MLQNKALYISPQKTGTVRKLFAILTFCALVLAVACEDRFEDPDSLLADAGMEPMASKSYNTIQACEAIFHKGDRWKSLCDKHGGWGNPNAPAAGMTCKKIDCERNVEHDVSVYFWGGGCYCKDGYRGPDPNGGLDPLPPGCEDAKRGRITFCQKNETCRGTGTRTLKGYSCRDVNKGFVALACSGMFSNNDWKKMRADCCYSGGSDACPNDPNKTEPGVCGCGMRDSDRDGDGTLDFKDACPRDPNKIKKGKCGCGVPEGTCENCVDRLSYCSSFKNRCGEPPFQQYCCATCNGR